MFILVCVTLSLNVISKPISGIQMAEYQALRAQDTVLSEEVYTDKARSYLLSKCGSNTSLAYLDKVETKTKLLSVIADK